MKGDIKNNYTVALNLAIAQRATGDHVTTAIDHSLGNSVTFHVSCNEYAVSFVATLQNSDDNSTWTDEVTGAGNTLTLSLTDVGSGNVYCPNPRARYSRLSIAIGGQCTMGVTSVLGPLRHVAP